MGAVRSDDPNNNFTRTITFSNLPGSFFEGKVWVRLSGQFGSGQVQQSYEVFNSVKALSNVSASNQESCNRIRVRWDKPNYGSSPSPYQQIQVFRNNTGVGNYLGPGSYWDDTGAPRQEDETYGVRPVLIYPGTNRVAHGQTVIVTGRTYDFPDPPTNIVVDQENCSGDLEVKWSFSGSNPDYFYIYRDGNYIASVGGSERSYRDNGLTSDQSYTYVLRAYDDCPSTAVPSNSITGSYDSQSASQIANGIPPATSLTSATTNAAGNAVIVNWADNTNIEDGFTVVRDDGLATTEFDVTANTTSYTDGSIQACKNYTYSLKTYNSCRTAGVTSNNTKTIITGVETSATFDTGRNKIEATDGEFGDRIVLKWDASNRLNDDWVINRINPLIPDTTQIANLSASIKFFTDNTANANTLYQYHIQGGTNCLSNYVYSNTSTDYGFRLAFGTINGQVTYDGGTAVEGVKVVAKSTSGFTGNSGNFNGTSAYAEVEDHAQFQSDTFSIQAYVKPSNLSGIQPIVSKGSATKGFRFGFNNNQLELRLNNFTYSATDAMILPNQWISVTATVATDSVILYVNNKRILQQSINPIASEEVGSNLLIAKEGSNFFGGQIDELRFFKRTLDEREVIQNFDVYINPSFVGLSGYWRFDEGFGANAYDYSKTVLVANRNHAALKGGADFSTAKPTALQLSAGAYTDERGSYFIPFVPFQGTGDNFIVTPSFGIHTFSPATTSMFIGGTSPNFSAIDFTDNSSFKVDGRIVFGEDPSNRTTCPVKDVFIKIDGQGVIQNGDPVKTDDNGDFEVRVPIGNHVISLEKAGHTFVNDRYSNNFQNDETLAEPFLDNTTMKVIGRVAGGGIQAAKPPGMGKGTNNIGSATITFQSTAGGSSGCLSKTVTTDATTGEYEVEVPPMQYIIHDFNITSQQNIEFKNNQILDLSKAPPSRKETDTIYNDSAGVKQLVRIDSVRFNWQRDFIYYATPTLEVIDKDNPNFGTNEVTAELGGANVKVPTSVLNLTYPIMEENDKHNWEISVFEEYANNDNGVSQAVIDRVPVSDGKILITNSLAVQPSKEFTIRPIDNFNGIQPYNFVVGQANINKVQGNESLSFTKECEIRLRTPRGTVEWKPNKSLTPNTPFFRAVIFGGKALGTSFATTGPKVVTMILRDPPGSNSSASWESGTTHTTVSTFENRGGTGLNISKGFKVGAKFSVGLGYTTETDLTVENSLNTNIQTSISSANEVVQAVTKTTSISTSSSIEGVGAMGDRFYGRAMNMEFGVAQVITLIDANQCNLPNNDCIGFNDTPRKQPFTHNGKSFYIGSTRSMFLVPGGYDTEFFVPQIDIINTTIPRLQNLRNAYLSKKTGAVGTDSLYVNVLPTSHARYGYSNDNPVFNVPNSDSLTYSAATDASGPSYTFQGHKLVEEDVTREDGTVVRVKVNTGVDSVWWYNQQIRLWQDALRKNEKAKVDVGLQDTVATNISFTGGGGSRDYSASTSRDVTESTVVNFDLGTELALKIAAEIGGNGTEIETKMAVNYGHTTSTATTVSTSTTFAYTIEDDDPTDNFSFDVFSAKDGYGPIFKTRGGQTMCPWQGEEVTKYYQPNTVINAGTEQREQPDITTSPTSLVNVPADGQAVFTLRLSNGGPHDQVFGLKVLENTNPNGAIITIDGIDPNRNFAVPARTTITKQLVVQKGPTHIKYDNIGLVLHSLCQYAFATSNFTDIADSAFFSVEFLPSCTDISIQDPGNQFVVNSSNDNKLPIILSGYDINHGGLEKIGLQFKPTSQSSWIPLTREWFKQEGGYDTLNPKPVDPMPIPRNQSYIQYDFEMGQLIDQAYQLRAFSTCTIPGFGTKTEYSPVISGIADRVNPHPFGTPSPADGVLDPNDDISIQFNEDIEAGSLTKDNFSIKGVLNGQASDRATALSFNGTSEYLEIDNGFDFTSGDFTVEFWAKRGTLGTNQTILSQGQSSLNNFRIFFNTSNQLEVQLGSSSHTSSNTIVDLNAWVHYTVTYSENSSTLEITTRSTTITPSPNANFISNYRAGGKTYIGKSANANSPDFFNGSLDQLRIWNRALDGSTEVGPNINRILSGRERGLIGYWKMDEGRGDLVEDVARFRHAEMKATWEFNPKSSAANFDGIDDHTVIDSASFISLTRDMDMTIEFWFKTAGGRTQALFSNGSGRFHSSDVNANGWSIEMDASNQIHVKHDSMDFIAVTNDFADDTWHHFALVVNRLSNVTAYIDAKQQQSMSSAQFGGFGGNKLIFGGRHIVNGAIESTDMHYQGLLDEVRIWNTAKSSSQIELEMYNRLSGDEFGLMAYYPFEHYHLIQGSPRLTANFNDEGPSVRGIGARAVSGATHSTSSPAVALQRPMASISPTWSVNGDKIIISSSQMTSSPEQLENVTLTVSVKDVKDLNGNEMESTKKWIAFVNKNQVLWQDAEKNLRTELGDTASFTTKVVNSGGEQKTYTISNIPNWLTASKTSGNIAPLSTETITFYVKPGVNIGEYSEDIMLTTDFGFNEKLLVNLDVKKTPPSFAFDRNQYQHSMSIIGQIRINGEVSYNEDDYLIAVSGNDIRGVAQLQYVESYDQYFAFLDVFSNGNDSIEFQVWNSAIGELHVDVTPGMRFVTNNLIGTPTNPQMFDAENKTKLDIVLNAGWNWLSFPIHDDALGNLDELFSGVNLMEGDLIKTIGRNSNAQYGSGIGWMGPLRQTGVSIENSYLVKVSQKDTLTFRGFTVDPDTIPITVVPGWNRIGFVSQKNMSVGTAMANYNASYGDVLKTQQSFAFYDDRLGWIGSLQTIEPTEGLLLKSTANTSFVYPRTALLRQRFVEEDLPLQALDNDIHLMSMSLDPNDYESSTSAIIDLNVCEELINHPDFGIAAFSNNELRGWVKEAQYIPQDDNYRYFMTIYGEGNESFDFKLVNAEDQEMINLNGWLPFQKDQVQGTPDQPIKFFSMQEIDCEKYEWRVEEESMANGESMLFPNPFHDEVTVQIPTDLEGQITIRLVDDLGRVVIEQQTENLSNFTWNTENSPITNLRPGVYHLQIASEEEVYTEKVIKI